jgi:hypothetical protein
MTLKVWDADPPHAPHSRANPGREPGVTNEMLATAVPPFLSDRKRESKP